jgi:hypothetical protein
MISLVQRLIGIVVASLLIMQRPPLPGVAAASAQRAPSAETQTEDSALFVAVMRSLIHSWPRELLRVRPSPVGRSAAIVDPTWPGRLLNFDASVALSDSVDVDYRDPVEASARDAATPSRLRILHDMGIDTTTNIAPGECPLDLAPAGDNPHCPASRQILVGIGLPRIGGAYYPRAPYNRPQALLDTTKRTLRVLVTDLRPDRAVFQAMDYVLACQDGEWRVVKVSIYVVAP